MTAYPLLPSANSSPQLTPPRPKRGWQWGLVIGGFALILVVISFAKTHQTSALCQKVIKPFAHTQCEFNPKDATQTLQLAWLYPNSNVIVLNFANLKKLISQQSRQLDFAMNAGMYDTHYAPIGYTVIDGKTYHGLNLKQGVGNFHLMPNGVFWWDNQGYHVTESNAMSQLLANGTKPLFATQSGPMLVINGQIHPSFDPNSTSYKLRNGVGVCQDGKVKFVISDVPVSFYQFAQVFKTQLQCDNALFLDGGRASALYSKDLQRQDPHYMGVMVMVFSTTAQ